MKLYEDAVVAVDEAGLTIKSNGRPGKERFVAFADIRDANLIDLRLGTGRYRLVGISPGRLRTFFHWDPNRHHKSHGISLDTGGWLRRAITPDEPQTVLEIVHGAISQPS